MAMTSLVELLTPTEIDFCLEAKFTDGDLSDLLLVRGHVIEVYHCRKGHVILHSRHVLASRILDIRRITRSGFDHLLLAFCNFQFSIVEYNRELREFSTVSLHCFAREAQNDRLLVRSDFQQASLVAEDEVGRFAAVRVGDSQVAFISLQAESHWRSSVVVSFGKIDERIRNVRQVSFVPGYLETTVAILYEPHKSWPFRIAVTKDTISLLIVTVDLGQEEPAFTKIASYDGLPADVKRMWMTSARFPVKGIILPGANEILHVDPGHPAVASLAINAFASTTTKLSGLRKTHPGVTQLTMSEAVLVEAGNKIFIYADRGETMDCQIHRDGSGRRIELLPAKNIFSDLQCRRACRFADNLLFVLPSNGDGIVVAGAFRTDPNPLAQMDQINIHDDNDIYAESIPSANHPRPSTIDEVRIVGRIGCLGTVSDFCIGGEPREGQLKLATCGGDGYCGQVTLLEQELSLVAEPVFQIANCKSVFPLPGALFVVSTDATSMAFSSFSNTQLTSAAIIDDERTLLATMMPIGVIQVTDTTIRLLTRDLNMTIMDVQLDSYSPITRVACEGDFLAIFWDDRSMTLYQCYGPDRVEKVLLKLDTVQAWDLYTWDSKVFLIAVDSSGALGVFDLQSQRRVFYNAWFSMLPVLLTALSLDAQPSAHSLSNPVTDLRMLSDPSFGLLMVATSKLGGLSIYRSDGSPSFLKLPGSDYCASMGTILLEKMTLEKIQFNGEETAKVLVLGERATWLVLFDDLGYPRVFPCPLPPKRLSMSRTMFGVYESNGSYSFMTMNHKYSTDYDWPYRRCPVANEGVRSIVYHLPSSTYAVMTAQRVLFELPKDDYALISDNDISVPLGSPRPEQFVYRIKLLSTRTGTFIDEFALEEDEYGLSLVSATLETKQTSSGRQPFIVVGTSSNRGEDRPARGRVLVFDVIHVVPGIDRPETDRKLKLLTDAEMKGPVTSLCHLSGSLVVGLASKAIVHSFENNESLTGVAFVDVGVYTGCMASVKNFFVVGDTCKSLFFNAYQEKPAKVVPLSRDFEDRGILQVEFVVDGQSGVVVLLGADLMGNLHLYEYAPTSVDSEGGQRLVFRGSLRLCDEAVKLRRLVRGQHQACLMAGRGGSFVLLCPLDEQTLRKCTTMQLRLAALLPHAAGVHPRSAKQAALAMDRPLRMARNVVDGGRGGLMRIAELPVPAREHLARIMNLANQTVLFQLLHTALGPSLAPFSQASI